ncbi:MAG: hypothetical protein M1814_005934 [Vezdaea aestivalis]|nr:MAG: hypothetical protein M1814_005934 [Vezdaea aestivalis]
MAWFGIGNASKHKHKHKHKRKNHRDVKPTATPSNPFPHQPHPHNNIPLPVQASPYPNQSSHTFQHQLAPPPPPLNHYSSAPPVYSWQAQSFQAPYQHQYAVSQQNLSCLQPPNKNGAPWTRATGNCSLTNLSSAVLAPIQAVNDGIGEWHNKATGYLNQGAAFCDQVSSKFNDVITLIDREDFSGEEKDLVLQQQFHKPTIRGGGAIASKGSKGLNSAATTAVVNTNCFAKANLYANSKLPRKLPPLKCYMPTYPLICHAAHYSAEAYSKPSASAESCMHISADWRSGTKAMLIKSVPIDATATIIFAIRGSQTFMDWAVNLNATPASPGDFLDDPGNLVHCGFLSVARKMLKPVAARLRALLRENPSRTGCSLVFTGHSAGGAVASLLYSHMLSSLDTELTQLARRLKRVHCITFGAPPVSLLPLQKPSGRANAKSLFLSFINEGDPVPRADKAYVHSLLNLYATPAPLSLPGSTPASASSAALVPFNKPKPPSPPVWMVPPATLSIGGRIVLLRGNNSTPRGEESVVRAFVLDDELLRGVMFGDPIMHMMRVYARRVERLATDAVKGKFY